MWKVPKPVVSIARSYVTSRWGTRPRDERERLVNAYRAGVKLGRVRTTAEYQEALTAAYAAMNNMGDTLNELGYAPDQFEQPGIDRAFEAVRARLPEPASKEGE